MAAAKPPVCVTGANGFMGTYIVKTLLSNNYKTIHLSIRPNSSATHLFSLPNANHPSVKLIIHYADLLDSSAIFNSIKDCAEGGVFHVASPCTLDDTVDPHEMLVDPAVKGTLNVLEAAKRVGVKRVVVTSSICALLPNPKRKEGVVVDETSWTDTEYCAARKKWYPVSKTLAEKAAWAFAKENDLDIVAINPSTCLGQLLQPGLNASCAVVQQLLKGSKDTQECHWLGAVHVQDVAKAQLLLFETPSAKGRYLCTNGIYQFGDFAEKISKLFPEYPIHRFTGETQPGLLACKDAAKRLIDLGLTFTPVEDAVRDTVCSLKAKGFIG